MEAVMEQVVLVGDTVTGTVSPLPSGKWSGYSTYCGMYVRADEKWQVVDTLEMWARRGGNTGRLRVEDTQHAL